MRRRKRSPKRAMAAPTRGTSTISMPVPTIMTGATRYHTGRERLTRAKTGMVNIAMCPVCWPPVTIGVTFQVGRAPRQRRFLRSPGDRGSRRGGRMAPNETLTITDNRTNQTYTVPIEKGAIHTMDLRKIKTGPEDFGLMGYDPAFMNTASCRSRITFIDGDRGILRYRSYNIEELAENCTYLEVAYLLLHGELPDPEEKKQWVTDITHHTMLHETTRGFMERFRYDAHPMGILVSTLAALSTVYPEAKNISDPECRRMQIIRLIAKIPTIAAYSYRHSLGFPFVYPDNDLSFTENFMNMLWKMVEPKYAAHPVMARALDI